jgi:hypothetical protein
MKTKSIICLGPVLVAASGLLACGGSNKTSGLSDAAGSGGTTGESDASVSKNGDPGDATVTTSNTGSGTGISTGSGTGINAGSGTGIRTGTGIGTGTGPGTGGNTGSVTGFATGTGTGSNSGQLGVQDACKQVVAAVCSRTSECMGTTGLAGLGYTSLSECIASEQAAGCATVAQTSCDAGQTYHADQAKLCVDGLNTLSCANLSDGIMPAACDLVCTVAGTTSATSTGTGIGTGTSGVGGSGGSGGVSGTPTYEQVLAAAPLAWSFTGTNSKWGQLSFNVPKNWTAEVLSDGVQLTSPGATGLQCYIFVLSPRAVVADETGRFQALLGAVKGLFPDSVMLDQFGGTDTMSGRMKGLAGGGWDYVGLDIQIGSAYSMPWMAIFGSTAVPVVPLQPREATCLNSMRGYVTDEVDGVEVFHTMKLSGFASPSPAPLKDRVVGSWFSASGNVGSSLILGANQQYISMSTISGTVPVNSYQVQDVYATWSGDGQYLSVGNIDAYFPNSSTKSPYSSYVRVFQEENSSDPSGWITRHCEIHHSTVNTMGPYEICLRKQP